MEHSPISPTPQSLFFSLLKLGIGTIDSLSLQPVPSEETWREIMRLSQKQAVTGIVMDGILKLPPACQPPASIKMKGIKVLLQLEQLNRKLNSAVVQVNNYLLKDGYSCIFLKGQGIALNYPYPLHRMPGDIDAWPDAEPDEILSYTHKIFPQDKWDTHHAHLPILKETEVELHFRPSFMFSPETNRRLQAFFREHRKSCASHRVLLEGTTQEIATPTDAFNRVYILQHIMRHLFGEGIGLRQLTDYCLLLRKGSTEKEKEETLQVLNGLNLRGFTRAVMYVLQEVLGLEEKYLLDTPDKKKGEILLKELLEGGNFGVCYYQKERRNLITQTRNRISRLIRIASLAPSETMWAFPFYTWVLFRRRIKIRRR